MTATRYRAKAGRAEWAIHLWLDNGHDTHSQHQSLQPVSTLEEAQEAAGAELRRLASTATLAVAEAYWWADLQHGTCRPIEHEHEGEIVYDATWEPTGHQYTGHCTEDGDVRWEQL